MRTVSLFWTEKQQLCTCITLFCTFLYHHCTTPTRKCLISRFVGATWTWRLSAAKRIRRFFSSSTWKSQFTIAETKKLALQAIDLRPSESRKCTKHSLDKLGWRSSACNVSFWCQFQITMVNWFYQLSFKYSATAALSWLDCSTT